MSEAYLTSWSFGGHTPSTRNEPGARNHVHETALREARFATDYRQVEPSSPMKTGFLTRLRLASLGPSAYEACNCPA